MILGFIAPAVAAGGGTPGATITIPLGKNRITGMFFNPAIPYDITITRSKLKKEIIVEDVRTSIGTFGYITLNERDVSEEVLQISLINQSGAVNDLNLSIVVEP